MLAQSTSGQCPGRQGALRRVTSDLGALSPCPTAGLLLGPTQQITSLLWGAAGHDPHCPLPYLGGQCDYSTLNRPLSKDFPLEGAGKPKSWAGDCADPGHNSTWSCPYTGERGLKLSPGEGQSRCAQNRPVSSSLTQWLTPGWGPWASPRGTLAWGLGPRGWRFQPAPVSALSAHQVASLPGLIPLEQLWSLCPLPRKIPPSQRTPRHSWWSPTPSEVPGHPWPGAWRPPAAPTSWPAVVAASLPAEGARG